MPLINWKTSPGDRIPAGNQNRPRYLVDGQVRPWDGPSFEVKSPVFEEGPGGGVPRSLGRCGLLDGPTGLSALEAAVRAYDKGRGAWPTSTVATRVAALRNFLGRMKGRRLEIARLICWEVGKPWADSLAEVDRTVIYGEQTAAALEELDQQGRDYLVSDGFRARVRRSPIGVGLCMGPYNYPLNETVATLLPALVMGNPVVVKLPRLGMLCTMPLLEDFAASFPPGVVNIISGEGATVVTPIVASGRVDLLAFIGSAKTAGQLKHAHPKPNRLRSVLGLGAKNAAIVLPDADLDLAVKEGVAGALTFNGQRCTALKIFFVHQSIADRFVAKLAEAVAALRRGLPFEDGVQITPLPDVAMVEKMGRYVENARSKGARVANPGGGESERTFFSPAVVYPVAPSMALWREEQFGPVVPVAAYESLDEVIDYLAGSDLGQQASVFGRDPKTLGGLIDALVNQVCRVNLNAQCRRGPDTFPFGGRKDSAEGTLSVTDALRVFSLRTLAAGVDRPETRDLMERLAEGGFSRFLSR